MKKYDPQIYPRTLFVIENLDELKLFHGRGGVNEELEMSPSSQARVWPAVEKETGHLGVAVYYRSLWFDTIAHEAVHIANVVFGDLDVAMTWSYDEHYAYFVGWIAEKIGEAHNLKIIKSKKK